MANPSFTNITPINPFKELSNTAGNAANYFFGQAQELRQAEQQELSNRLAEQQFAENRRVNDSVIAKHAFDLKTAKEEKADRERIQKAIKTATENKDSIVRNHFFKDNPEFVATAGGYVSDAFRNLAKKRGLAEAAPEVTADEGTEEYQTQKGARDQWFTDRKKVSKEFNTKVRPLVMSTFLDKGVIDKSTAASALTKHLLAQNVPVEQIERIVTPLSSGFTDFSAANAAAREAHTKTAGMTTDLAKTLAGLVAKPNSSSNSSNSNSGGTLTGPSATTRLKEHGLKFKSDSIWPGGSSYAPIQEAVKELMERDYTYEQANKIVVSAAVLAKKDNRSLDVDEFTRLVGLEEARTPKKAPTKPSSGVAAHNAGVIQGVNTLVNKALADIDAAMSTSLHTRLKQSKLSALEAFANKHSGNTSTKTSVGNQNPTGRGTPSGGTGNPNPTTSTDNSKSSTGSGTLQSSTSIGSGTLESLGMAVLGNPEKAKALREFLQLRIAADNEKDPTTAIALHNQVKEMSSRFKGIEAVPTGDLKRVLDSVGKFNKGKIGPIQQSYGQLMEHLNTTKATLAKAEKDLIDTQKAYSITGQPQFKGQTEELIQRIRELQDQKELWGGLVKQNSTSFLNSLSN